MKLLKTEKDMNDLATRIQNALEIDDSEQMVKAVDFTMQSIIGRQLSMYHGLIEKKKEQLDGAVMKLKDALEASNGSEVADQNVIRCTNWVTQQEKQLEFLQGYVGSEMAAAQDAYKSYFGKAWVPYSETRNIASKMKETAAKQTAEEILKKYAK